MVRGSSENVTDYESESIKENENNHFKMVQQMSTKRKMSREQKSWVKYITKTSLMQEPSNSSNISSPTSPRCHWSKKM